MRLTKIEIVREAEQRIMEASELLNYLSNGDPDVQKLIKDLRLLQIPKQFNDSKVTFTHLKERYYKDRKEISIDDHLFYF